MLAIFCPSCNRRYDLHPSRGGSTAKCPCGTRFTVPLAAAVIPAYEPPLTPRYRRRQRTWVLPVTLLVLVLGAGTVFLLTGAGSKIKDEVKKVQAANEKPIIVLPLTIHDAYAENEIDAQSKYKDKLVEIDLNDIPQNGFEVGRGDHILQYNFRVEDKGEKAYLRAWIEKIGFAFNGLNENLLVFVFDDVKPLVGLGRYGKFVIRGRCRGLQRQFSVPVITECEIITRPSSKPAREE